MVNIIKDHFKNLALQLSLQYSFEKSVLSSKGRPSEEEVREVGRQLKRWKLEDREREQL